MINTINKANLNIVQVVPVLAKEYSIRNQDNIAVFPANGLENLIEVMDNALPEILKKTLHNVQIVSIKHKRNIAKIAIAGFVATAFAIGLSPIPFADALILVPIEIAMITSITSIYGISVPNGFISAFLTSTIGCGTATLLGKTLVSNILKFIPGANIAAGVISGAVAGTLSSSLGFTYMAIIEQVYKGEINLKSFSYEDFKKSTNENFREKLLNHYENDNIEINETNA